MYIYESHMGGLYTSDEYEECEYCEQCGDSDKLIGNFDSAEDFLKYFADRIDCNDGYGGYDMAHIMDIIRAFKTSPNVDGALAIIKTARSEDLEYECE